MAWCASVIDTPRDGSCFFSSIAIAMNDSIDTWYDIEELRIPMEKYWEMYKRDTDETLTEVTPDLVRYMCSLNVDDGILELYNVEAGYRIETEKVKAKVFETKEDLGKHMRVKTTWGDHASFHSFLKSLNYKCGVVVFDAEIGGMSYLPPEWTKNKKTYICLRRESNHYGVVRLRRKVGDGYENQPLCVSRGNILDMVRTICEFDKKKINVDSF